MTETLIFRQSSMQRTDGTRAKAEDIESAVPPGKRKTSPDAIGFTELDRDLIRIVKARCEDQGYYFARMGSIGLAVNNRNDILDTAGVDVLPGLKASPGGYKARGILEVTFVTRSGIDVTVHEAHWITDADTDSRDKKRIFQSEAMVERVRLHGQRSRLSFWMGDTNSDERRPRDEVQKALTQGGLVSIYDALDKYPRTHGKKTIDVIGHYHRDRRVQAERVVVGKPRGSDHRVVTATYSVKDASQR